jgi:hypothetical protein
MNLSETALMLGDHTLAHDAIAEAIARLQELGSTEVLGIAYNGRARIAFVEGHDAEAAAFVLESMQQLLDLENRVPIIENSELMGELCARRGMPGIALELIHAAALMRERYGVQAYEVRRTTQPVTQPFVRLRAWTTIRLPAESAASRGRSWDGVIRSLAWASASRPCRGGPTSRQPTISRHGRSRC